MKRFKRLRLWILDIFYPARCEICGKLISYDKVFCSDCQKRLTRYKNYCHRCGFQRCLCEYYENSYDEATGVLIYDETSRKAVINLKRNECMGICRYFAKRTAEYYKDKDYDAVCCVPMTAKRKRKSGFNQAELLARSLSRELNLPFVKNALSKDREFNQHELDRTQRHDAAHGAYSVINQKGITGKRLILCDDVMTTGSTLNECSFVLKKAGALKVAIACLANASGNGSVHS